MPTRRQTLFGIAPTALGGVAMGVGAFENLVYQPSAELRVLADPRRGAIELRPGRDDAAYVVTDPDGLVTEIELFSEQYGVNKRAYSRFEEIVELHHVEPGHPITELYFTFEVEDEGLSSSDPTPEQIATALTVVAEDAEIAGDGSTNYLEATDVGHAHNDRLTYGQHVAFGIGIDLRSHGFVDLPDPETYTITLRIDGEFQPGGGSPPGGGPPNQ